MTPLIDLVGKRFGLLTVIEQVESHPKRGRQWACKCECGGEKIVPSNNLTSGGIKSCGCLHRPRHGTRRRYPRSPRSPIHAAWLRLRAKCLYPSTRTYQWIGAKGIGIEWPDLGAFKAWAEEAGYQPGYFLARRDRTKNFGPENCFWSETRPKHSSVTITNRAVIRSDGQRFDSLADAVRATPKAVTGTITVVCQGKRHSHAGFGWEYADKNEFPP